MTFVTVPHTIEGNFNTMQSSLHVLKIHKKKIWTKHSKTIIDRYATCTCSLDLGQSDLEIDSGHLFIYMKHQ